MDLGSLHGSTLDQNARDVGLSPALGTVVLILITPMTQLLTNHCYPVYYYNIRMAITPMTGHSNIKSNIRRGPDLGECALMDNL